MTINDGVAPVARSLGWWNALFGMATVGAVVCFFGLKFSPRPGPLGPRTLYLAVTSVFSSSDGANSVFGILFGLPILLAMFLPTALWLELAMASSPLSKRMRGLLIGQAIVSAAGVGLTVICMSLALAYLAFGGNSDPTSAGFYIIPSVQAAFVLASVALAIFLG